MSLTNNQLRWARIHIKNKGDRQQIFEGKEPLELIKEILITIKFGIFEKANKKRILEIINYLEETTLPV